EDEADVALKITDAEIAFYEWRETSYDDRANLLLRIADLLISQKNLLADTMMQEMGKPIRQAKAEVEKCVWVCRYYAANGERFLKDQPIATDASNSFVRYNPYGVILAIMPWNFPLWQVFRFLAPAIMCGNATLLKHARNTFQSAINIHQILKDAGLPENLFQNLFINVNLVEKVIAHPVVKAVTFTGSTTAGSKVAALAGKHIKKSVLELGGSNALVVFDDADIDEAVRTCVAARFQNNGQSCIAGKRLYVHQDIYDNFIEKLVHETKQLVTGDPADDATYISVMARNDLAEQLKDQLDDAVEKGAKLICGGYQNQTYFEPSILTNCHHDMKVMHEETFGPLLGIETFRSEEDIIQKVNQSNYALGVSLFTNNQNRIKRLINQLEESAIFINELVKSDPRLPFGGYKNSGYGRELAAQGIREFAMMKTIYHK
ncbi:MAG: NAD-dependent succinate-semialdehyde dehydrogenase, partial [Psychroflexus sp.]|nr:NAD-dependent succinate-semialdehyde dehydrogenase [Psychroflexus sp.]